MMVVTFLLTVFLCFSSGVSGAETLRISANEIICDAVNEIMPDECSGIDNFSAMSAHRGTVEAVLLCQALHRGGMDVSFDMMVVPNYSRAIEVARRGVAVMPAETAWDEDIDKAAFYVSSVILEDRATELGVYVLPSNTEMLQVKTLSDLQNFISVSSEAWVKNWEVLKQLKIRTYSVPRQKMMFRLVGEGRADFLLTRFSLQPDLSVRLAGVKLIPVPEIKVTLPGTRHFIVSRSAPNGRRVFEALEKGLALLRKEGRIGSAYRQSGFLNSRVSNWKEIRPAAN